MGPFRWLESRLGVGEFVRKVATEKRPPATTGWLHTIGYAALSLFLLQAITGIALGFFYVPAADHAYDSIRVLEHDVEGGALLRAVHHWGASAMIVLVFVHAIRVFFQGAYKRPREFTWLAGLGLFGAVVGLGFTGYLLPWDQKAYFATKVGVNIAGSAPEIGPYLKTALYGAQDIGPSTLNRFFALHVLVLPAVLVLLLVVHMQQIQRHGIAPTGCRVDDPGTPGRPYHPYHTWKEAIVAIAAVATVIALAWRLGAPLEAEADGADLAYVPRPDWYFFAPFELLKWFKGENEVIATMGIPAALGTILVLLPFVDRNKERRITKRPIALVCGTTFLLGVIGLTVKGALDKPEQYATPPHPLFAPAEIRLGYDTMRHEGCFSCHTINVDGKTFGQNSLDANGEILEAPSLNEVDYEPEDLAEFLGDTGMDDMPSFPHLSSAERLAIGKYLLLVHEE